MSVKKTQTKVNAYEFHSEAKANVTVLDKADSTVDKANRNGIDKYLSVGEDIRSKNVTYGDYAKAAMFPEREQWLAYRAEQMELFATSEGQQGSKDPRPEGQTSCQRALDIAKRFHDERKRLQTLADEHNASLSPDSKERRTPISFLVDEYEADTGKSVTVIDFANWCQGKKSGSSRQEPKDWKFYLSEAINKAFADGADEMMIFAEVDHILGKSAE